MDRGDSTISTSLLHQLELPTKVRSRAKGATRPDKELMVHSDSAPRWLAGDASELRPVGSKPGRKFLMVRRSMRLRCGGSFLMWFQRSPMKA